MKTVLHKANTRGNANYGWLNAYHSFSFSSYYNAERMRFGLLRVLNDDTIAAGMGFGKHPHDNMEIVTIPLSGDLHHNDSTGRDKIIKQGDVQIMSAGSGIQHSEVNASKTNAVKLLQIWILPNKKNIEPRYEQKTFSLNNRHNTLQTIVAPNNDNAVWINQQAWLSLGNFDENFETTYTLNIANNGVYAFVIKGAININNVEVNERDGLGITETTQLNIKATTAAELLLIEVPMQLT